MVLHPLGDHRRQLPIERLGVTLDAAPVLPGGLLQPGYQSIAQDLRTPPDSAWWPIEFGFPAPEVEEGIVAHESGVDVGHHSTTGPGSVRPSAGSKPAACAGGLPRVLIAAGRLVAEGPEPRDAGQAAIAGDPLTDDLVWPGRGLAEMIEHLSDTGGRLTCPTRAPQSRSRSAI